MGHRDGAPWVLSALVRPNSIAGWAGKPWARGPPRDGRAIPAGGAKLSPGAFAPRGGRPWARQGGLPISWAPEGCRLAGPPRAAKAWQGPPGRPGQRGPGPVLYELKGARRQAPFVGPLLHPSRGKALGPWVLQAPGVGRGGQALRLATGVGRGRLPAGRSAELGRRAGAGLAAGKLAGAPSNLGAGACAALGLWGALLKKKGPMLAGQVALGGPDGCGVACGARPRARRRRQACQSAGRRRAGAPPAGPRPSAGVSRRGPSWPGLEASLRLQARPLPVGRRPPRTGQGPWLRCPQPSKARGLWVPYTAPAPKRPTRHDGPIRRRPCRNGAAINGAGPPGSAPRNGRETGAQRAGAAIRPGVL